MASLSAQSPIGPSSSRIRASSASISAYKPVAATEFSKSLLLAGVPKAMRSSLAASSDAICKASKAFIAVFKSAIDCVATVPAAVKLAISVSLPSI